MLQRSIECGAAIHQVHELLITLRVRSNEYRAFPYNVLRVLVVLATVWAFAAEGLTYALFLCLRPHPESGNIFKKSALLLWTFANSFYKHSCINLIGVLQYGSRS